MYTSYSKMFLIQYFLNLDVPMKIIYLFLTTLLYPIFLFGFTKNQGHWPKLVNLQFVENVINTGLEPMFSRRTMDSLNEVKTKRKLLAINLTDQDKEKSTIPRTSFVEEEEGREISIAGGNSIEASDFAEFKFASKSTSLTKEDKIEIDQLFEHSLFFSKEIKKVIILSWSNEDLPFDENIILNDHQIKLASQRNASIRNYLNFKFKIQIKDKFKFTLISMAENNTNNLSVKYTDESKIKKSLVLAGLPTTSDELIYPSKSNHSIIYLILL